MPSSEPHLHSSIVGSCPAAGCPPPKASAEHHEQNGKTPESMGRARASSWQNGFGHPTKEVRSGLICRVSKLDLADELQPSSSL